MEAKKRRIEWPVWIAVGFALPVLYVLSFRPTCWLVARHVLPFQTAKFVYGPLVRVICASRESVHNLAGRCCNAPVTLNYPFGRSRLEAPFAHMEYEMGVEEKLRKERLALHLPAVSH